MNQRRIIFLLLWHWFQFLETSLAIAARRQRALRNALASKRFKRIGVRAPYCLRSQHLVLLEYLQDNDLDFRYHFRMTRTSFYKLLTVLDLKKSSGWTIEVELLVFLLWLGCGTAYRIISATFGIPRATVGRIIKKFLNAVTRISHKVIRLPADIELETIASGFASLAKNKRLNKVVGSIDGCHIRITAPVHLHEDYYNRKCFYSIQMQAVCDFKGKFLDVFIGYPGSVHDSRVLKNSPLYTKALYPPTGYVLVGDQGYPCILTPIALITPFPNANTPLQLRFNTLLSRARCIVERAFGLMKGRWRSIFTKALEVKLENASKVIMCCAVMHNICVDEDDNWEEEVNQPDVGDGLVAAESEGNTIREEIAGRLSAPHEIPAHIAEHDYFRIP